ncbi:MAG: hypothetical protein LQ350_005436 [Teloschistes chrysophthalmus]|nr:MAG: hypothetical protein LQ350_005436 [Niorma chrysophthalma]
MEHLPLPRDVAVPGPSPVPFVCQEDYDGGPFLTYFTRFDTSSSLAAETHLEDGWGQGRLPPLPISELESLIQTWIFFGLLTEILGDLFVPSQYVTTPPLAGQLEGHERVINTLQLVPTIRIWKDKVHTSVDTEDEKNCQYEHIASCLRLASTVLSAVKADVRPDFNHLVRSSLASVGELLSLATNQAYAIGDNGKENRCPGGVWRLFYDDPRYTKQLLDHGCCPCDVHRIRNLSLFVQTYHFLLWMDGGELTTKHQECTDKECRTNQISLGRYKTKHQRDGCQCTDFYVDVEEVIRILSRDQLPLLRITPGSHPDEICIDVDEATPDKQYVAISHVWADGLGNPYSNSLPKCQLQYLYESTKVYFKTQIAEQSDQRVFVWIDTLLCPVEPVEAKLLALKQIKTPYVNASHVLVLDSTLQQMDAMGLSPQEVCMRIFTTGWMRRLWTLQEGALPSKLWFRFKDFRVNLDAMATQAKEEIWNKDIDKDFSRSGLIRDITIICGILRNFFHAAEGLPAPTLMSVDDALQFRSVSVATDEPILIAGLLNLDLELKPNDSVQSRMQRLWSLIRSVPDGIPTNILFCRGPRLHQTGYRWAPTSLLSSNKGHDGSLYRRGAYSTGHLTPNGLNVRLSAFSSVTMASAPRGAPKNPWALFSDPEIVPILCRNDQADWFFIRGTYTDPNEGGQRVGATVRAVLEKTSQTKRILLESAFDRGGATGALLVHDTGDIEPTGRSRVASDMIVHIGKQNRLVQMRIEAVYQASRLLLNDEITAQYADLAIQDEEQQRQSPAYANLEAVLQRKTWALAQNINMPILPHVATPQHNDRWIHQLGALMVSFYLGHYYELGPMLPSDTEWCVD